MIFLPRDFIETKEGLVFAVVDSIAENGKVLAFLSYAPTGKLTTETANFLLSESYPQYLHYSTRLDAKLHAVPLHDITRHHQPRVRMQQLLANKPKDAIEAKLLRLVKLLADTGFDLTVLGVTGSLLIGRQTLNSDVDLVVYGRVHFFQVIANVRGLVEVGQLDTLNTEAWHDAYGRRGCELSFDEYLWHERRKGNLGMIEGTKFDLALIAEESAPKTETAWHKTGFAVIKAQVLDDTRTFDQPARYPINHAEIGEVLSFTQTYTGQAKTGETIEAAGQVEVSSDGRKRLVVGSSREALGQFVRVIA